MPGSQSTSKPCIRARRARISWIVLLRTWPSVSTPVTFGGGMTIEKAGFDERGLASKSRCSIQRAYHFGSTDFGSYVLGSSVIAMNHPRGSPDCKNDRDGVRPLSSFYCLEKRLPGLFGLVR